MPSPSSSHISTFLYCCMTCAGEKAVKSMGWGERDDISIWIDWFALNWDCGLANCGTYVLSGRGLFWQNGFCLLHEHLSFQNLTPLISSHLMATPDFPLLCFPPYPIGSPCKPPLSLLFPHFLYCWIEWFALNWDHEFADCGTNVFHGCRLFCQNEILLISKIFFISEYVSSYLPHFWSTPEFPLVSLPHIQWDHHANPLFRSYFLFLYCYMT